MSAAMTILSGGKPAVISLRSDPGYLKAEDRLRELTTRVAELDKRRQALLADFEGAGSGSDLDRRAAALLESGKVEESTDDQRQRLRVSLGEIADQLRVAGRAVELQKVLVQRERTRVGAAIRARLAPEHRAIVSRIHKALVELSASLVAEEEFRDRLMTGDVPTGDEVRPMPFGGDEVRLDKSYSMASLWVAEARAFKLLD